MHIPPGSYKVKRLGPILSNTIMGNPKEVHYLQGNYSIAKHDINITPNEGLAKEYIDKQFFEVNVEALDFTTDIKGKVIPNNLYTFVVMHGVIIPYYEWTYENVFQHELGVFKRTHIKPETPECFEFIPKIEIEYTDGEKVSTKVVLKAVGEFAFDRLKQYIRKIKKFFWDSTDPFNDIHIHKGNF